MKQRRPYPAVILLIALFLLPLTAGAETNPTIIRVTSNTATGKNGSSWEDAMGLSEALVSAAAKQNPVEIWVAGGKYLPQDIADESERPSEYSRDRAFVIPAGVAVYGGFAGGETSRDQRDWKTNVTILSGDLEEDDSDDSATKADNSYHVVIMVLQRGESAILDGFTITGGVTDNQNFITVNGQDVHHNCGGGVYAVGKATLENNTIRGNETNVDVCGGGGVYAVSGSTLTNNTIYGNTASGNTIFGGGVSVWDNVTLTNNTIYGNTASGDNISGGGVYAEGSTLTNNILWGNTGGANLFVSDANTITYNLIGDDSVAGEGNLTLADGITDPRFVNAAAGDFRLLATSPAIGAGKDKEGNPVDMGAWPYLLQADKDGIVYVNRNVAEGGTGDGSSWANAKKELSDALVTNAAKRGVKEIWVAGGADITYTSQYIAGNGATERDRAFVIPAGVAVYGGFAGGETERDERDWKTNVTTLSGNLGEEVHSYHVVIMVLQSGESAILDGFTITAGVADGQTFITVNDRNVEHFGGGGVYAWGDATLENNTIEGNKASGSGFGGGGVYAEGSTLTNNTIRGNTVSGTYISGGGVYAMGSTLTNNTIYGNSASGQNTWGGGVYAMGSILTNNTIYGNEAIGSNIYGGGVYAYYATLTNNILWGNTGNTGANLNVGGENTITYNLIGDATLPEGEKVKDNLTLADGITDPGFVDAAAGDFRLLVGSPAIDAGSNAAYLKTYPPTDAAGNPRVQDDVIDMGAYEGAFPAEETATYHRVTLTVASGIDLLGVTPGEHWVTGHLYLQFLPQDKTLEAEAVMLLIDGVETAFKDFGGGSYFSYILNNLSGEHTVLIALREYPVTLPQVEGVTYNIGAGTHLVGYGEKFTFTLTLADGIDPAAVHVYANGQEIGPTNLPQGEALRASVLPISSPLGGGREGASLTYTIDKVITPITVVIEGAGEGTTGNADIARGDIQLRMTNDELQIENTTGQAVDVSVYTVTGQNLVQLRGLRGSKSIRLQPGVYLVQAGGAVYKVSVN